MRSIGQQHDKFRDVNEIAILRGSGLGDLLFALPAVEAIAAAYPNANITLLGAPLAKKLFQSRPSPFDTIHILPVADGIREAGPDGGADDDIRRFVDRHRGRYDLALQLHGGGVRSNAFILKLEARHTVGPLSPGAPLLERTIPYTHYQHETLRRLEIAGLAGATPVATDPELTVDKLRVASVRSTLCPGDVQLIGIHVGAKDPRRRWATRNFSEVVTSQLQLGRRVVLIGDSGDQPLVSDLLARLTPREQNEVVNLQGRVDISHLPELLAALDILIANDSGPRHLADAVGTATVGIFWYGNVPTVAPLDRERNRVLIGFQLQCPQCGTDFSRENWFYRPCGHQTSLVDDVKVTDVIAEVDSLLL
ncbi:glycosyltransferase family 9 protein [Curtobacterium oceanosedimentum]|uniref:glycosyltransferase family 9 protein n=1 Tax=Curtobacterium oceanosedimentum TaxID=465820 RepID=UPI0009E87AD9|nr:glycosyltransferase family 9 protein [Curtobacterium oceanosedimentum]